MTDTLKIFIAAILMLGLIFFIGNRAIRVENKKRKALYIGIFGLVISNFFFIGYFIEKEVLDDNLASQVDLDFFMVGIILTIFFVVYYVIVGFSRRYQFSSFKAPKEKQVPTIKNKQQHLYIVFRYNNSFILREIKEKDEYVHYAGLEIKFPNKEYFHDEFSKKVLSDMKINIGNMFQIGTATVHEKKDQVYYCYIVDINELLPNMDGYKEIQITELIKYQMNDFDKSILYRIILRETFDIEIPNKNN